MSFRNLGFLHLFYYFRIKSKHTALNFTQVDVVFPKTILTWNIMKIIFNVWGKYSIIVFQNGSKSIKEVPKRYQSGIRSYIKIGNKNENKKGFRNGIESGTTNSLKVVEKLG